MTRSLAAFTLALALFAVAPLARAQEETGTEPPPALEAVPLEAVPQEAPAEPTVEAAPQAELLPEVPEPTGVGEAVDALAERLARTLQQRDNWIVAVADFPDLQGQVNNLGRYLAQRATTRFTQRAGYRAIDRLRVMEALDELRLGMTALANPTVARRVGNQIGFNALVVGTLADLGDTIEIDARINDLDSQQLMPAVVVRVPKTPELTALLAGDQIAARAVGSTGAEAAAAEAAPKAEQGVMVLDATQPPPQARTDQYRVTVESARKDGRTMQVTVAFENLTGNVIPLAFRKGAYLIDGQGDRWNQAAPDSAGIYAFCCEPGIELIPGTRRRTKLEFRGPATNGISNAALGVGEEFSLVGKEVAPQKERTVVVPGMRLKAAN